MTSSAPSVGDYEELRVLGHTCANLDGDFLFVWGGTNNRVALLSARNPIIWIHETFTGRWQRRTCTGECPPYLSGSSSCLIGEKMFIFGGRSIVGNNWLNCLYSLDLKTFIWTDCGAQAQAQPTQPVGSEKSIAWSHNGKLYVFGGYGQSQVEQISQLLDRQCGLQLVADERWPRLGWNNQLVEYDPSDNTWRWPRYAGECPEARSEHQGALMGDKLYVFGGYNGEERRNDLHVLDMRSFEWQRVAVISSSGLQWPLCPSNQDLSGETGEEDNEWDRAARERIDRLPSRIVSPVSGFEVEEDEQEQSHALPEGRSLCSLTPISDEEMLMHGGLNAEGEGLADCWIFSIPLSQWTRLEYTDQHHQLIRPRIWHSGMRTRHNDVVMIGGTSTGHIDGYCNDLLVFNFEPRSLKRIALETVARAPHLTMQGAKGIPSTLIELIKSRGQALAHARR